MKKKIIAILVLMFSLTGCTITITSSTSINNSNNISTTSSSLDISSIDSINSSSSTTINSSSTSNSSSSSIIGSKLNPLVAKTCSSLSVTLMEITASTYGDAIYINCGADFNMVVDAGNFSYSINDGERMYDKFLKNITKTNENDDKVIDMLITTHADGDHMGGIDAAFTNDDLQATYIVDFGYISNKTQYLNYYRPTIEKQIQGGANYCSYSDALNNRSTCGKRVYLMEDLYLDFINTGLNIDQDTKLSETSFSDNDASVVFLMTFKDTTYFFSGDMTGLASNGSNVDQSVINDPDFKNDVTFFKAAHHGSNTHSSNSNTLLSALNPKYIGISTQLLATNIAHPNSNVISRMLNYTDEIYYNGVNGDLTFTSVGNNVMEVYGTVPERGYAVDGSKILDEQQTKLTQSIWFNTCYSSNTTCSIP